jgi:hypothetical protein
MLAPHEEVAANWAMLEGAKLWSRVGEFGILRGGEVQGYILRLGNGTGGHHECCS